MVVGGLRGMLQSQLNNLIGDVMPSITDTIKELTKFSKHENVSMILKDLAALQAKEIQGKDLLNTVNSLRKRLKVIESDTNSSRITNDGLFLADAAYNALLALAENSPRNKPSDDTKEPLDPINRDTIKKNDRVFMSTGYVFDINYLAKWIKTANKYIDPVTGQAISERDQITIQTECSNRKIDLLEKKAENNEDLEMGFGDQPEPESQLEPYAFPQFDDEVIDEGLPDPGDIAGAAARGGYLRYAEMWRDQQGPDLQGENPQNTMGLLVNQLFVSIAQITDLRLVIDTLAAIGQNNPDRPRTSATQSTLFNSRQRQTAQPPTSSQEEENDNAEEEERRNPPSHSPPRRTN